MSLGFCSHGFAVPHSMWYKTSRQGKKPGEILRKEYHFCVLVDQLDLKPGHMDTVMDIHHLASIRSVP